MKVSKILGRLGIDLGKNVYHLFGMDHQAKPVLSKKLRRMELEFLAKHSSGLIGMQACGGAHYCAREITKLGHEVRLMARQFVKPYLNGDRSVLLRPWRSGKTVHTLSACLSPIACLQHHARVLASIVHFLYLICAFRLSRLLQLDLPVCDKFTYFRTCSAH